MSARHTSGLWFGLPEVDTSCSRQNVQIQPLTILPFGIVVLVEIDGYISICLFACPFVVLFFLSLHVSVSLWHTHQSTN